MPRSWSPIRRRNRPLRRSNARSGSIPSGCGVTTPASSSAGKLRPGNAGSNTAVDHVEVLTDAIAQIPGTHRRKLLVRSDGAGASHKLLEWLDSQNKKRGRRVEYSIGFAVTEPVRAAIGQVPKQVWTPAIDADGEVREGGDVAELTGLLDLSGWPDGMRVIVRRERPHPGAQLSLFEEADGWRYQAFVTNTTTGQLAFLEARHRAHARVEDGSVTPRTPAWGGSRHGSSASTRPGCSSRR